jgi:hypothetical protein
MWSMDGARAHLPADHPAADYAMLRALHIVVTPELPRPARCKPCGHRLGQSTHTMSDHTGPGVVDHGACYSRLAASELAWTVPSHALCAFPGEARRARAEVMPHGSDSLAVGHIVSACSALWLGRSRPRRGVIRGIGQ